jgi:hypothetical protein
VTDPAIDPAVVSPDPAIWQLPSIREKIARAQAGRCVLTGGQTGVDTLAAQAAVRAGLAAHLVFPLGLRQETGALTPAGRAELAGATVHELASPDFRLRTWTCSFLGDAIILLDPAGGDGCQETIHAASQIGRPLLDLTSFTEISEGEKLRGLNRLPRLIMQWATDNEVRVLMIAGCRASLLAAHGRAPGLRATLEEIVAALATLP